MEEATGCERRAVEAPVGALDPMPAELAGSMGDVDVACSRPLAVLSAGTKYSAVRSPQVDSIHLVDEFRPLRARLAGSPGDGGEFASRYAIAHRASPATAALHDRALATCRTVATRHALVGCAA
jgi:hypothetical protein